MGSLPPKSTYATASTGVAACHIGGTTLHAFAGNGLPGSERLAALAPTPKSQELPKALLSSPLPGIGSGKASLEQCIQLAERPGVRQHWLACQHLIIDEISMVDGKFFDRLEAVAR